MKFTLQTIKDCWVPGNHLEVREPGCRKYEDDGIGSDRCDFWYHYECENITSNIGNEALKLIEYICRFCNDDMLYENRNHLECDANEESNIVGALQTEKDLKLNREKDHPKKADDSKKNKDTNIDSGDTVQFVSPKPSKTSKKITEDSTTSQPNDKKNGGKTPVQAGEKRKCTKSNPAIKTSEKDEIIVTQKTRILNLENEIKHMKTVIDAIQAGKETSNQNQTSNENAHAREYRQQDHMAQNHIKDMLLDQRLRAIETQMMQNMCIQTAITTQIAIQAIQHPTVLPHIYTGQVPVHPDIAQR
ncbi:unnamed protein product [Mytilus coruscus]|uniref:Zinc finger PHD-type domain-containing protein n=1 Tax=Mytilus coruscus TaxID=42192 RepID=A0A6J8E0V4_MYTCO|nr:unnamed protein product [Mytilus coruscus]